MNFEPPPRRQSPESIVPMINVVFLLLIFFLMTAQIAPPDPFGIEPPESAAGERGGAPLVLQVSAIGETAFGEARGARALDAIAAEAADRPVTVRAHAALPAADLASIMAGLAERGIATVELATNAP